MSRLTQRGVGHSDNNEERGTPYLEASMAGRIGSTMGRGHMLLPERQPVPVAAGNDGSVLLTCASSNHAPSQYRDSRESLPIASEQLRNIFNGKIVAPGGCEPDRVEDVIKGRVADAVLSDVT
jgi:hypothetical protein